MGLLLLLASFAVYRLATVPALANSLDNEWYVPTSLSLLFEGDAELGEYAGIQGFRRSYRLDRRPDGIYNYFPIGTSLLALPVVALALPLTGELAEPARSAWLADLAADVFAATSVWLLFLVGRRLAKARTGPDAAAGTAWPAFSAALVFAFATPHFAIHAGGLWSHNSSSLLLLVTLLALLAPPRWATVAAGAAFFAYLCRPTAALWVPLLVVHLAAVDRSRLRRFLLGLAPLLALFVGISFVVFGRFAPGYFEQSRFSFATALVALPGHLLSPNRGLLVFAPVLLFAFAGAWQVWRRGSPWPRLYRSLCLFGVAHWLLVSTYAKWWGGGAFGPRLMAEVLPALCLLLVPALTSFGALRGGAKLAAGSLFLLLTGWSLFVEVRGATDPDVYVWNSRPKRLERAQQRIWDWGDLQFLR